MLSECAWTLARTGHLTPRRNILKEGSVFFRSKDGLYRSGLYAHASSVYEFDLGGRWERLKGEAALPYNLSAYSSVDFIIELDGKAVLSRRRAHNNGRPVEIDLNLRNLQTLRLITRDAGDGRSGDTAFRLNMQLSRPRSQR